MGSLWEAEHIALRSPVAIKFIRQALGSDEEVVARFAREARAAAALRSPHVVQILDHGVHEDRPFIAMELLVGETLAERIEREGRLSAEDTGTVLTHVGRALMRAHEVGIVHRDLKPSNVFVVRNDDEVLIKVFDFGIAKALNPGDSWIGKGTNSGVILGTPYYMSPEQAEGGRPIEASTDIWAMGVLAFECLLGKLPFSDSSLGALVLAICSRPLPIPSEKGMVPPGFDEWFAKACARAPTARFATAKEAASEFRRLVLGISGPLVSQRAPDASPELTVATEEPQAAQALQLRTTTASERPLAGEHGGEVALTSTTALPMSSGRTWLVTAVLLALLGLLVAFLFIEREPIPASNAASKTAAVVATAVVPAASTSSIAPVSEPLPSLSVSAPASVPALESTPKSPRAESLPAARRAAPKPAPPVTPAPTSGEKKRRVDLGI